MPISEPDVDIEFSSFDLQTLCESEKLMKKKFGVPATSKLKNRLTDLQAVNCVNELVAGKPHPLKYKRLGQFSVIVSGPLRLIFECCNDPIPKTNDEAVDWNRVTKIRIISIEDYHE